MPSVTHHNLRKKGSGSICRPSDGRPGWLAKGPRGPDGKVKRLGRFQTYREAEEAIAALIARKKVA